MHSDSVDENQISLPTSGKVVLIRNYTTQADDEAYNDELFSGVDIKSDNSFEIPMLNTSRANRVYVRRLVKSIDGDSKFDLGKLRSEDYKAIEQVVDEITSINSPKPKADK